MLHCSPKNLDQYKQTGSCFDLKTLRKIAGSYNRHFKTNPIEKVDKKSFAVLKKQLETKLKKHCNSETCWVSKLGLDHDKEINDQLRPKTPREWVDNPNTWLNNFNIEAVMMQYEKLYSDFKFLGVFPVNFEIRDDFNQCFFDDVCDVRMNHLLKKGINYVGFIINLDRHDEPGSHWTGLFMCINPDLPAYGIYYYDSVGSDAPPEMKAFMNKMKKQGGEKFKYIINSIQHQTGDSECGMFSMYYIIKWITKVHKNKNTSFEDIVSTSIITDENIAKLRKVLFRPVYEFKKAIHG